MTRKRKPTLLLPMSIAADRDLWDEDFPIRMHTRHRSWDELTAEERGRIEELEEEKEDASQD